MDRSLVSFSEVIPFEFHFCFARSEAAKRINSTYAMQEGRRCVDSSIHRVEPHHHQKDDLAQEPIAASYSATAVLAEAAHKTGRAKADFELRQISREEYDRLKALLQL